MFNEISARDLLYDRGRFSAVFDARSPSEYALANVPNAINFYAMTDEERADVGTLYARKPFEARSLGASYICKNLADHLLWLEKRFSPADRLAIYCAKGGMRSSSIAVVLTHIGYRIWRVQGGFKAYRAEVVRYFDEALNFRFITLDAPTGSGKSELIRALNWSVDLEALANHKGSAFGEAPIAQPKTAKFENDLQYALSRFDPSFPIAIEAESRSIGRIVLPQKLYAAIQNGFRVFIKTPIEDRVKRIASEYGAISGDFFNAAMKRISPYISRDVFSAICEAFNKRDLENCAFLLLTQYYDKVYKKAQKYDATVEFDTIENAIAKLESIRSNQS
ncbi:MAG: tRNA 2-selenouridine(34) synthase MnmH [Helicobacteraceae bacterium]|nr:tRNA 2-selenouridine(34) synthase MnmH [Helicobacteraceae bacterium]